MRVLSRAELVEDGLSRLMACFNEELTKVEVTILETVHDAPDPDRLRSRYWELWTSIADAQDAAAGAAGSAREQVWRLVADAYRPGLGPRDIPRVGRVVTEVRAELDRAFGVSCEGGTLARLAAALDECLDGAGGGRRGGLSFAERIARQVGPAQAGVSRALRDLGLDLASHAAGDLTRRSA